MALIGGVRFFVWDGAKLCLWLQKLSTYQAGHLGQDRDHEDTSVGAGASHIRQGASPGLAPRAAIGPLDVPAVVP